MSPAPPPKLNAQDLEIRSTALKSAAISFNQRYQNADCVIEKAIEFEKYLRGERK